MHLLRHNTKEIILFRKKLKHTFILEVLTAQNTSLDTTFNRRPRTCLSSQQVISSSLRGTRMQARGI